MAYKFYPPTVEEGPMGGNWLFSRYTLTRGITVYKIDGQWYEDRFPVNDDLLIADAVYLGGHEYEVTLAEKEDLESAGYEVVTE